MPWSGTPEEQKEKRRLYNLKNKEIISEKQKNIVKLKKVKNLIEFLIGKN